MASVFKGLDVSRGGAEVAIKIMHPHLAQDRTFTARFKREAQAASMVRHPNSVAIYEVGEEAGIHYIAMELCLGKDLREILRIERRLVEPRAVRIVASVCDALHAAHQLGVIHRDLKPENVMVQHDPTTGRDAVKVLDFGIAKLVDAQPKIRVSGTDSDPPPALTQFGVVVGTPAYMSPEQCRGQPLDGRSDLYTCGILLYQLATGQLPFDSPSPFETAGKQAFEPPPPPSTHLPTIDRDLEALILRTLSKSPDERPQSANELKELCIAWLKKRGEIDRGAAGNVDLRTLGKTMPMKAASVEEYMRARGIQGPFHPQGQPGQAPHQPLAHEPTGMPGARGPMPSPGKDAATPLPPRDIPLALQATQAVAPQAGPGPDHGYPQPPAPLQQAPHERVSQVAEAPAKKGWGCTGLLFIVLSVAMGVGIGVAIFRYFPHLFPAMPAP